MHSKDQLMCSLEIICSLRTSRTETDQLLASESQHRTLGCATRALSRVREKSQATNQSGRSFVLVNTYRVEPRESVRSGRERRFASYLACVQRVSASTCVRLSVPSRPFNLLLNTTQRVTRLCSELVFIMTPMCNCAKRLERSALNTYKERSILRTPGHKWSNVFWENR